MRDSFADLILDFCCSRRLLFISTCKSLGVYHVSVPWSLRGGQQQEQHEGSAGEAATEAASTTAAQKAHSDVLPPPPPASCDTPETTKKEDEPEEEPKRKLEPSFGLRQFLANAAQVAGSGADLYLAYALCDVLLLLIFIFNYYTITGGGRGSIIQNVQDNVIPGPFAVALLVLILSFIVDRMLYVSRSTFGKLILNLVEGLASVILYCTWRQDTLGGAEYNPPASGIALLYAKFAYLYISSLQLRRGFPKRRRHDPFTDAPEKILPWIGYQIFRLVPFLWEIRVLTDWTVEHTALRFPCYLKVENLYDIVYDRYVSIADAKEQQPIPGTPVRWVAKLTDGIIKLLLIILALIFPLLYYSTFNPVAGSNEVSQISVSLV